MKNHHPSININQLNDDLSDHNLIHVADFPTAGCMDISMKSNNSNHFGCYHDSITDKYIKVYNKNIIWRRDGFIVHLLKSAPFTNIRERQACERDFIEQYDIDASINKSTYDACERVSEILTSDKYDILPEVVFDTKDYIGIEWSTTGWRSLDENDLTITISGKVFATKLLKSIMRQVVDIQLDNLMDKSDDDLRRTLHDDFKVLASPGDNQQLLIGDSTNPAFEFNDSNYKPCIGISGIDADDFIISTDGSQVKYADIDNINIIPRVNNSMWLNTDEFPPSESSHELFDVDTDKLNLMFRGKRSEFII